MTEPGSPRQASVAAWVLDAARRWPDDVAVEHRGRQTTYRELAQQSSGAADALTWSGLRPPDRVVITLARGIDALAAYFGTLLAGGIAVPVAEGLRERQLDHVVSDSGAAFMIYDDRVALGDRERGRDLSIVRPGQIGIRSFAGSRNNGSQGDIAQLLYTSGSTGRPRGVMVTHGNVVAGIDSVVQYLGLRRSDRLIALLPFGFDYGLSQALCSVRVGATLVIERSPVAARIVRTLRDERISVVAGVPTLWQHLLGTQAFREEPLDHLRVMTNSGAHLPTGAVRDLRRCQPSAELYLMYGLTEAFRSTFLSPSLVDAKPGSIGRAIPGAEILVLGPDGSPCAPGVPGELVHRGPTVALGYWDDLVATAAVFRPLPHRSAEHGGDERVVFSGDLVVADRDGDLAFVARDPSRFKRSGHRFSPVEVTEGLLASGQLVDVAVDVDEELGNGIDPALIAHVVLCEGGSVELVEDAAARELPAWMRPDRVVVHDLLPTLPNGKHDLVAMRTGVSDES